MVCRHVVAGEGPLGRRAKRNQRDGKSEQNSPHGGQCKRSPSAGKKKTARTFWGARAGRPVTQLVLKLSTGGFHLNRSTRIDATRGRMLLTKTTFFENCRKPPRPPATWQVHSVAPSPSNQLFSACTPRAVKHLPRRDNKFSQETICRSAESPNCQPSQPSRYLFP